MRFIAVAAEELQYRVGDGRTDLMRAGYSLNERELVKQKLDRRTVELVAQIGFEPRAKRCIQIDAPCADKGLIRVVADN